MANRTIQKKGSRQLCLVLLIAISILLPRVFDLDRFVTADEPTWITSTANFYYALGQRDFATTYQLEHPGVTLMWAGTAGFLLEFPALRGLGLEEPVDVFNYEQILSKQGYEHPERVLAAGRLFVVLGVTLILALSYVYARRLIGPVPALIGFLFIAFDPYHISLSRLFILDGLLSGLMLLSALSFLYYLQESRPIDLVISGLAAGLSWLTKSPSIFLIPFTCLLVGVDFLAKTAPNWKSGRTGLDWNTLIRRQIAPLLAWGLIGVIVFFVVWPAMWVDPIGSLDKMFGRAFGYVVGGHKHQIFFDGEIIESGNLGVSFFRFYPVMYLWRTTPVTLLGLAAAVAVFFLKWKSFWQNRKCFMGLNITLFAVSFIALMTFGGKKMARYMLPAYLALELISALGWVYFLRWVLDRWAGKITAGRMFWLNAAILGLLISVRIGLVFGAFPYYLTYFNPILGGIEKAQDVKMIGWGEGLEQAAQYLNRKPEAENLRVISWYAKGCFSYYFDGHSKIIPILADLEDDKLQKFIAESDYAVIYIHQWQRQTPRNLLEYLDRTPPEHTIWVDGLEYVRIYKIGEK